MKIKILASGSKGNCTYISSLNANILIDVGISYKKIKNFLEEDEINMSDIDAIVITHTHNDHINGLASVIKKENYPVYIKEELYDDIRKIIPDENINIIDGEFLKINDLDIECLKMSHDADCYSFIINDGYKSIYYVTDTGYINRKHLNKIKNKNMYLIESNHNEEMLLNGPYPLILKQRVLSDTGHMSNKYAGKILKDVVGEDTEYVVLLHISENNNNEEKALEEINEELEKINYNGSLLAAKQNIAMEMIEI